MSVTVQTIPQEPSGGPLKDVSEFFVPTILSFNLKKTTEDRLPAVETENTSSRQNGDIATEEDENEMAPIKMVNSTKSKQQTSSFLLQPFLQPVDHNLESNKENPVLKALFGGGSPPGLSPWEYARRTSFHNCHPFKKTELSHDLTSDDIPVQVPKSLMKKSSKSPKSSTKRQATPESKSPPVLKEVNINSETGTVSSEITSDNVPTSERVSLSSSFLERRKRIAQQSSPPPAVKPRFQYVNGDRLIQLRSIVDNAIKDHKVYSMSGCYNSVRNALKQRGWIEKIDSDFKGRRKPNKFEDIGFYDAAFHFAQKFPTVAAMKLAMQTNSGFVHNDQIHYTGPGEAEIMNRMLRNVKEDLCWLSRPYPYYCWKDFDKYDMINRLPRAYFSNKIGLCTSLQQIQWFYEDGVCSTQFPRTYNISMKDELEAFKEDFRLTACICMLKWFLQTYNTGGESAVRSPDGKVDMSVIEFALRRCAEFIKTKQHEDIDILETPIVWEYQWDQFITQYYRVVDEGHVLKDIKEGITIKAIVSNVQSMLNLLKPYWPQYDIDGYQNFWIVKPGGRCCGAGIIIKNNLDQILMLVNPSSMKETRYVVQKYIERPLLIYNTKFDIRQWFLVTNVYPLTVWMYRESYLRFCSQPFTLRNTHESIHLCNNAIQRKYKNARRDRGLPDENMWDCYTFQTYLKAIGQPDVWEKCIYPGMKEGFIGALLASQDSMERKKNCFELYGADFMISETLTDGPWLIEINSNPAMDSSTSVTGRMCPQVLEDIIKVVIDRRDNKCASTGGFEMVYKQNCPPIPPYLGMSLCIKGKKAYRPSGDFKPNSRKSKSEHSTETLLYIDTEEESVEEETVSVRTTPETPKKGSNSSDEGHNAKGHVSNNKLVPEQKKTDRGNKRRKVDWVRKNIESLKSVYNIKQPKGSGGSSKGQEPLNEEAEFREQVFKLLESKEMKEFLREVLRLKEIKTGTDKCNSGENANRSIDIVNESKCILNDLDLDLSEDKKKSLLKLLKICQERKESEVSSSENVLEGKEFVTKLSSKVFTKSCPNFDATFEKELRKVEDKEKSRKSKSDDSIEVFFSATSLPSKANSKTSLDYFRDWKSSINETRKTCEDMLTKLQEFQEQNSKVKFQDALKKRVKEEVDFIKRIREYRKNKMGRISIVGKRNRKDSTEGRLRGEESRHRGWDDGDGGLTPLAINSETGAVRSINESLPKIKQRSRPLLPNGSSGNGRKIQQEQSTYCH